VCTASVHNTTQNSSDNLPSYIQTNIIAQMLSTGEEGNICTTTDVYTCHDNQDGHSPVPGLFQVVPATCRNPTALPREIQIDHFSPLRLYVHRCITATFLSV